MCALLLINMLVVIAICTVISFVASKTHIMTSPNVTVVHPLPSKHYLPDASEKWIFDFKTILNFTIVSKKIALEESHGCKADSLRIVSDFSQLQRLNLCYNMKPNSTLYTGLMYGFDVEFKSDSSWEGEGFSLEITGYPPDNKKLCEMMHSSFTSSITSTIMEYERMYPALLNCSWDISAPNGMKVVLTFDSFDIEFSGPECPYDRVEVWELPKLNQSELRQLGKFCGRHNPWQFKTNSTTVQIRFLTDDVDNTKGFSLKYYFTKLSELDYNTFNVKASQEIQHIPLSSYIGDRTSLFKWTIRTHPGFRIRFQLEGVQVNGPINIYDGPNSEYENLQYLYAGQIIYSNGFYMTIDLDKGDFVPDTMTNLSYVAVNHITGERTGIAFSGQFLDYYQPQFDQNMDYVRYYALIVPPKNYPRFNVKQNLYVIENQQNTDDCGMCGLAFYHGTVSFDNLIGPFCDFDESYAKDLLNKVVGSTSVTYAVSYNYKKNPSASTIQFFLGNTPEKCRGFQLTEQMFRSSRRIDDNKFFLTAQIKQDKRHVEIFYNESVDDCILILFLPYRTHLTDTRISLTGQFKYRICRQWGIKSPAEFGSPLSGSKYHRSENCSENHVSTKKTTELSETFPTTSGWSREYMTLEISSVSEKLCPEYFNCAPNQENRISLKCAHFTLRYLNNDCRVNIVGPDDDNFDYVWVLRLAVLFHRSRPYTDTSLVISETPRDNRSVVTTTISSHKIGHLRSLIYKSLPGVQLIISSFNAGILNFKFSQERISDALVISRQVGPQCIEYRNSCYHINIHQNTYSWGNAKDHCEENGGYLVSINTAQELDFLKSCLEGPWQGTFYGNNRGLIFIGLSDSSEAGLYRWVDESPLTVSDWYYPFGVFGNVLPDTPKPPIPLDRIQPVVNSDLRCVAMVPGNPWFSTNWRKVPCGNFSVSSKVYSICEMEIKEDRQDSEEWSVRNTTKADDRHHCPETWIFVSGHCLRVLTSLSGLIGNLENREAQQMCLQYGGFVAAVNGIHREDIRKMLVSIGFMEGSGDIWVELNSGKLSCISLPILSLDKIYQERLLVEQDICEPSDGNVRHVLCETVPIQIPQYCRIYQFRCEEGTCLSPDKVCDNNPDCLSAEDESNCTFPNTTFICDSGETISIFKYCDFYVDCEDGSDESLCIHPECFTEYQYPCANGQCINIDYRCDYDSDCFDNSDEHLCDREIECKDFKCPILGCIPNTMVEDLKSDCPDSTDGDEIIDMIKHRRFDFYIKDQNGAYYLERNYETECPENADHQRCHQDHVKCFPRHRTCLYDHDIYNQLLYCSNGAHLRHCEDFECPDKFKCPSSYCIPHHKVCDGVRDCAKGEDEINCDNRTCPNQLRCGTSNQCVSLEYVCDGQVHCKSGVDDEMFCSLLGFLCPSNCTCLGLGVSCTRQELNDIPIAYFKSSLVVIDLSHNSLNVTSSTFDSYTYLVYLYLQNNSISELSPGVFRFLTNLLLLDLSDNMLAMIEPETFVGLGNLQTLRLHGNHIQQISPGGFLGLSSLPELNLSGMRLQNIGNNTFQGLSELRVLSMSDNNISFLDPEAIPSSPNLRFLSVNNNHLDESEAKHFQNFTVTVLHTDSYVFCCMAGYQVTECFPPVNSYTSCSDLIPGVFLQGIVWTFAILALVGNGGAILWRILTKKVNNIPSIFILNLSIADLLMGVYLLALSATNITYKGVYILNDKVWRYSHLCRALGVLATVSCEMSMFTLVIIALDRTKRLAYPFTAYQFDKKSAMWTMVAGWIISLLISAVPFFFHFYFGNYYSRNAVCLPFNFADPLGKGWEFSLFMFVALNALGLLLVVIMYGLTYSKVKETQKIAGRTERTDLDVARKLTIIIVTDVLCVIPLTMTNLLSVLGEPINRDLASVLTAVILPINSALNPYLFTFSAFQKHKKTK